MWGYCERWEGDMAQYFPSAQHQPSNNTVLASLWCCYINFLIRNIETAKQVMDYYWWGFNLSCRNGRVHRWHLRNIWDVSPSSRLKNCSLMDRLLNIFIIKIHVLHFSHNYDDDNYVKLHDSPLINIKLYLGVLLCHHRLKFYLFYLKLKLSIHVKKNQWKIGSL